MRIERTFDAGLVNRFLNDPSILPNIRRDDHPTQVDAFPLVTDAKNIILAGEYGLSAFMPLGKNAYEADIYTLPEGRGKYAVAFAKACLGRIFNAYGADRLEARVPSFNRVSALFVRKLGFSLQNTAPKSWLHDSKLHDVHIFGLERHGWHS